MRLLHKPRASGVCCVRGGVETSDGCAFALQLSVGERSSRGIERRCREDVPTRVICANRTPDHTTISRFRARLRRCREELEAEQATTQAAYEENLQWRAQWEAEHGRKFGGRKPFPPDPDGLGKRTINTLIPTHGS
jgi:hypothetical protein